MHDAALHAHLDPDRLSFLTPCGSPGANCLFTALSPLGTRKRIVAAFSMKFSRNVCLRGWRAAMPAASSEK